MSDRFFSTIDDTTQCFLDTSLQPAHRTCAIAPKSVYLDQQAQTYIQQLERSLLF
ncbi:MULTISPECIES: hypothetical protein [unclassified Nostoc]|uniref:hypothetical protein n=1 Tax=unclassified Nostoc TaxID=2593658 RepID=UPI00260E3820|nr:hypothetical protein [Nostoc sp. S13]